MNAPVQTAATRPAPRSGDANGKKVLTVDDYTRWRIIDASAISADGKWVAYGMRVTNVVAPDATVHVSVPARSMTRLVQQIAHL